MVKEVVLGSAAGMLVLLALWGVDVTPFLLLGGLLLFFWYAWESKGLARGPSGPGFAVSARSVPKVRFEDIGGQEVAKRELLEALQFIKESEAAKRLGIRPLKGILLAGPPGNGKTLMAKAAASYAGAAFVAASGSEFVEVYAGVGAQRVRRLFQKARAAAQKEGKSCAVIFIDEIEVLGAKRGRSASHMEYDQTLNELLVQMDGLTEDDGVRVLVMAATNRPDLLDPALLRPGRFDRTVHVEMPDREGRLHILRIHTRNRPLAADVDLEELAREMYGFSGAQIESAVNEAAIHALRAGRSEIRREDFKEAIEKVMMGERLERKPRPEEQARIAHHEAGHAFISELVRPGSVSSVTVTSRGKALGYMRQAPEDDPYLHTRQDLLDQIAVCVAGACAEEVFFGSRSTGCAGDIRQAMTLAQQLVAAGMSRLGVVDMEVLPSEALHAEMQAIVKEQEAFARQQIEAHRDRIHEAALLLLEREKLDGDTFRSLIRPPAPVTSAG